MIVDSSTDGITQSLDFLSKRLWIDCRFENVGKNLCEDLLGCIHGLSRFFLAAIQSALLLLELLGDRGMLSLKFLQDFLHFFDAIGQRSEEGELGSSGQWFPPVEGGGDLSRFYVATLSESSSFRGDISLHFD